MRALLDFPFEKCSVDFAAAYGAAAVVVVVAGDFVVPIADFAFGHCLNCFGPLRPHCHSCLDSDLRNLQSSYLHQRHSFLQDLLGIKGAGEGGWLGRKS